MNERVVSIGTGRKAVSQQTASNVRRVCQMWKSVCAGYPLGIALPEAKQGMDCRRSAMTIAQGYVSRALYQAAR